MTHQGVEFRGVSAARGRFRPLVVRLMPLGALLVAACGMPAAPVPSATAPGTGTEAAVASGVPDWYGIELTDVRTGHTFAIQDLAGKVVLIETMAEWCPTCLEQQAEVKRLHDLLGNPEDLVSISLDIDLHEDEASLKDYATSQGYDWYFAVAPLEVARALGNLYSAQYLNPPLSPMLVIDRDGSAIQLPHGVKKAEILREMLDPYLAG